MSRSRIDADPTSTTIATAPSMLRRSGAATGLAVAASLALSACGEASPEKPEITNVSVLGVELPDGLAKNRQVVLEFCRDGPGSDEMSTIWDEAGYNELSGKSFFEAVTYSGDFGYIDAQAVIDYGTFNYATAAAVAENCQEASLIISKAGRLEQVPDALSAVEAFRENGNPNEIINLDLSSGV